MKPGNLHTDPWAQYADALFSLLTFPLVIGLLYSLTRAGCGVLFERVVGR